MAAAPTYPVTTIAKLLMISERRVQQLTTDGVIPKAERGRYELASSVQGYIRYLRDRAIDGDAPDDDVGHKTRLLKARADIAEFEAERLSGSLVAAEEVEKTWTDITARFRQRCLSIAPRSAPIVAMETAIEACHEIIETFVHEALAELAATAVEDRDGVAQISSSDIASGGTTDEADDIGVG